MSQKTINALDLDITNLLRGGTLPDLTKYGITADAEVGLVLGDRAAHLRALLELRSELKAKQQPDWKHCIQEQPND